MRSLLIVICMCVANVVFADQISVGEDGIDSVVTGLDGSGVMIGEVDQQRSGKAGYDDPEFSASNTIPAGVYFVGDAGEIEPNVGMEEHPTVVAEAMIGKPTPNASYVGVAPNAQLLSIGFGTSTDDRIALAMNRVATLNGGLVRAINISFGRVLQQFIEPSDGNSHLARFVDWSTRQHDVLYVTAMPEVGTNPYSTPSDSYNDITVAASDGLDGMSYYRWWDQNRIEGDAEGPRTSIDIIAPGTYISQFGWNDVDQVNFGTSVAAPHVTGAIALLHQYAQQQIDASNALFLGGSRQSEVIKSVLLNSADKLDGVQGSNRTIFDSMEMHWAESEAYNNPSIPLDDELGAGHLNVRRAVQQFAPGEQDFDGPVPLIGWDYSTIGGSGSHLDYTIGEALEDGEYITITLAWDRRIESTGGNVYNEGDTFFNPGLANLDLQLMTADGMTVATESISEDMNLEHIFFQIQNTGEYKIRVNHSFGDTGTPGELTNYALAWWYGGGSEPIPGDYDNDGDVDEDDYNLFSSNFGSTTNLDADGNDDGIVNAADYVIWRDNLGNGAGSGSATAVPEPGAWALLLVAVTVAILGRSRRVSLAMPVQS